MAPEPLDDKALMHRATSGGPITTWVLLGPFQSDPLADPGSADGVSRSGFHRDFLEAVGGEAEAVLTPETTITYEAVPGKPRTVVAQRVGPAYEPKQAPDLTHILYETHVLERDYDQAVGYGFCYLYAEQEQTFYAYLGSDGSPKVWLNGALVHQVWRDTRQTKPWQDRFKLHVQPGLNRLLIKIDNRRGWWGFQLEIYEPEQQVAGLRRVLRGLALHDLRIEDHTLSTGVRLAPEPFEIQVPVEVLVVSLTGRLLTRVEGKTGETFDLRLPEDYVGPVWVRAFAGFTGVDALGAMSPDEASCFVGDFAAAVDRLRRRCRAASQDLGWLSPAWRRVYAGVVAWLDAYFESAHSLVDAWAVESWTYVSELVAGLEEQFNVLTQRPKAAFPLIYEGRDRQGVVHQASYHLSLPEEYRDDTVYPMVVELHGSGRQGQRITYRPSGASRIPSSGEPVILVNPISPHRFWDTVFLDSLMDDLCQRLSVDADRIYLEGASGGGKGAWDWGLASPDLFAAMVVLCGNEGYPFRAPRLATTPVRILNGELDLASYPFLPELMVCALERAGADVTYELYPELAHNLSAGYDRADLKAWLLARRRGAPAPSDPLAVLGLTRVTTDPMPDIVELPAVTALALTEAEDPRYPQDNVYRAAMKLYQVYRKPSGEAPSRRADGQALIRTMGDVDGPARICLLAPDLTAADATPLLERLALPPMRAVRAYVRCPASWAALGERRAQLYIWLAQQGLRRTGEERAVLLTVMEKDGERFWELQIGIEAV